MDGEERDGRDVLLRRLCVILGVDFASADEDEGGFAEMSSAMIRAVQGLKKDDLEPVGEWVSCNMEDVPMPPYDIKSPVVGHLLTQWSSDENKVLYIISWVECLNVELPEGFPRGLQLAGCSPEIKEGFLLLLIPIIRGSSIHPIDVFLRRRLLHKHSSGESIYDLRVRVGGATPAATTAAEVAGPSGGSHLDRLAAAFPLWRGLGLGAGVGVGGPGQQGEDADGGSSSAEPRTSYERLQSSMAPLVSSLLTKWTEISPFRARVDSSSGLPVDAAGSAAGGEEDNRERSGSMSGGTPSRRSISGEGSTRVQRGSEALMSLYGLDDAVVNASSPGPGSGPGSGSLLVNGSGTMGAAGSTRAPPPSYEAVATVSSTAPAPPPAPAVAGKKAAAADRVAEKLKALREEKK